MKVQVGVATDIGRVREGNEDSYLIEPPLYAVADGMGGHRGGEVASQLALETIEDLFRKDEGSLVEQVRSANHAVYVQSQEDTAVSGMGTTLTAALVEGSELQLAHVGDSRAYLLRAGSLRQLTADHTLVARMVKTGEITEAEAEVHPHRNVLTRSLGTEADVQVDQDVVGLLDGDRLLLCSDGLTGMVTEDQIKAILETEPDPQRASDRLIKAANRAGGIDNITVVVLDAIGEDDDPVGPGAGCTPLAALADRRPGGPGPVGGDVLRGPNLHRPPVVRGRGRRQGRRLPGHPGQSAGPVPVERRHHHRDPRCRCRRPRALPRPPAGDHRRQS